MCAIMCRSESRDRSRVRFRAGDKACDPLLSCCIRMGMRTHRRSRGVSCCSSRRVEWVLMIPIMSGGSGSLRCGGNATSVRMYRRIGHARMASGGGFVILLHGCVGGVCQTPPMRGSSLGGRVVRAAYSVTSSRWSVLTDFAIAPNRTIPIRVIVPGDVMRVHVILKYPLGLFDHWLSFLHSFFGLLMPASFSGEEFW